MSTAQTSTRHAVVKTETPSTRVVTTAGGGNHYAVTQTAIATATAVTTTTGSTVLGNTFACYSSPPSGTPTDFSCSGYSSCSYGGTTSAAACPSGARFLVQGNAITNQVVSNNTYAVPPTNQQRMTDAMGAQQTDVGSPTKQIFPPIPSTCSTPSDADQTALLMSMARRRRHFRPTTRANHQRPEADHVRVRR